MRSPILQCLVLPSIAEAKGWTQEPMLLSKTAMSSAKDRATSPVPFLISMPLFSPSSPYWVCGYKATFIFKGSLSHTHRSCILPYHFWGWSRMINLMVFMIVVISCRFSSTDVKMICPFWETYCYLQKKVCQRGTIGHCRRRPGLGRLVVAMIYLLVIDMIAHSPIYTRRAWPLVWSSCTEMLKRIKWTKDQLQSKCLRRRRILASCRALKLSTSFSHKLHKSNASGGQW